MYISSFFLLSTVFFTTALADKHRLCCCAGIGANDAFSCLKDATQKVVDNGGGKYKMSKKGWAFNTGAPITGDEAWMYASDKVGVDDGWLGGDEVSDLCDKQKLSSRCFTPNGTLRYKNDDDP